MVHVIGLDYNLTSKILNLRLYTQYTSFASVPRVDIVIKSGPKVDALLVSSHHRKCLQYDSL